VTVPEYPFRLNRIVVIKAKPETVFSFFTDSARWAAWWGSGSTIDAKPGGHVFIRHPNGIESSGEVLEVTSPKQISFTYGFSSGDPIPPGASRVTIRLEPHEIGTRLELMHEFGEAGPRDEHVQGWRFQLSLFANVVANELHANATSIIDAWFGTWAVTDDLARREALERIVSADIRFYDRFSLLEGLPELSDHIGASQRFMPGMSLRRKGQIQHCQGTVIGAWVAIGGDGKERWAGTNIFTLCSDRRITSVTGFTDPNPVDKETSS
jgi:uncharacterized protein YndB with AHSA1/START domain